jgi:2-polyprenyl-3-methyl-5-hydroxy-6-metoxy-1,4-benzoquinol methylase
MDYREHYRIDAIEFDYWGKDQFSPTETRRNQAVFERVSASPGSKVLDCGSGRGWFSLWAAGRGAEVTALDLSEENLQKIKEQNPSIQTVFGDACDIPLTDEKFDWIVALEVLEHIVDPKSAILNWLKFLKPDGKLLITVPYKETIRYTLCVHCNGKTPINAHLHSFNREALIKLLNHNGYWVKETHTFVHKLMVSLHLNNLLKFLPYKTWKFFDKLFRIFGDRYSFLALIAVPKN